MMRISGSRSLQKARAALLTLALLSQSGAASAGASILVDVQTGSVLAQENAFQRWYPASLTKLMTAYIAFSAVKAGKLTLESPIVISANAAKQPPSKMGYKPGNRLSLDNAPMTSLSPSARRRAAQTIPMP
jgi:D-alanyl-D-alanine carboxypeptidase